MIDRDSPPGSYRAALSPSASCAACRQTHCEHPDAIYAGIAPAPVCDPAAGSPFHASLNTAEAQDNHAA